MPTGPKICFDRYLPDDPMQPMLSLGFEAIMPHGKAWPNGSVLRVRFLEGTSEQQALAMHQARWWSEHANLRFVTSDAGDAEIRITFDPNDGAWSYLGTDCRSIPRDQPTMNLGFQDGGTSGHEFGHAIGLAHEHQNPQGGIRFNEAEVMRDLMGPPNFWTPDQIRHNVLNKYSADQIRGTAFDPNSIMLYAFPARWTLDGFATHSNEVVSAVDGQFVAGIYPRTATPPELARLTVGGPLVSAELVTPGEEDLYLFDVAQAGRHVVETNGSTDVVMRLYGPNNRTLLIAEDDDGGIGLNSRIARTIPKGEYLVQIRHYNRSGGAGSYKISVKRS
jgi:hypothetical protein